MEREGEGSLAGEWTPCAGSRDAGGENSAGALPTHDVVSWDSPQKKPLLGKRARLSMGDAETSGVHRLMQVCAFAFADMSCAPKQMLANRTLLDPVLAALDSLAANDLGVPLGAAASARGERVEIFVGPDFSVDVFSLPAGAHLPILDAQEELGLCKILGGALSVRYLHKQADVSLRRTKPGAVARGRTARPWQLIVKNEKKLWSTDTHAHVLCDVASTNTVILAVAGAGPATESGAVVLLVRYTPKGRSPLVRKEPGGRGGMAMGSLFLCPPHPPPEASDEDLKKFRELRAALKREGKCKGATREATRILNLPEGQGVVLYPLDSVATKAAGEHGLPGEDKPHRGGWECELCLEGGSLALCDKCGRGWHAECLKCQSADDLPDPWYCRVCVGHKDGWECELCDDGGRLILCDNCPRGYHAECLGIKSVKDLPDPWHCEACQSEDEWVGCDACEKWRIVQPGWVFDRDKQFTCSMIAGVTCQLPEGAEDGLPLLAPALVPPITSPLNEGNVQDAAAGEGMAVRDQGGQDEDTDGEDGEHDKELEMDVQDYNGVSWGPLVVGYAQSIPAFRHLLFLQPIKQSTN